MVLVKLYLMNLFKSIDDIFDDMNCQSMPIFPFYGCVPAKIEASAPFGSRALAVSNLPLPTTPPGLVLDLRTKAIPP